MPPEPPPWDRKDSYKERKHERSELGSGATRWRESPHHGSRDFVRWGSPDFRRLPSGHGKQGTWHLLPEESSHGFAPSRSADKFLEDGSYRPSGSRADGKYSRSSRDNRGKDWKGHQFESGTVPSNVSSRQLDMNVQRSADDMLTYAPHPYSDFVNTWDELHSKDQHDKMGTVNGLGTGQRSDQENSLGSSDWRPLKWTRSGSLSSRGSGFSNSSSSRNIAVDIVEAKTNVQTKNVTPVGSPSADAAPCATYVAPSEETSLRKKQRLGWGEGLAKYEKKKVEGPDESVSKNAESAHSLGSNLAVRSPRVIGFSDCASPATPTSVARSSSPGREEKPLVKAMSVGDDTANLSGSPDSVVQHQLEEQSFYLEGLDLNSIANLSSSIMELGQSDDSSLVDSNVVRSTAMNKLMRRKGDILKALEMTESEIDQLENELKSINSESGSSCSCAAVSSSLLGVDKEKSFEGQVDTSNLIPKAASLQIFPKNLSVGAVNDSGGALKDLKIVNKNDDIDSPGISTSRFVEPLALGDAASPSYVLKQSECFGDLDTSRTKNIEVDHSNGETVVCEGIKKFSDVKTAEPCSAGVSLCADEVDVVYDILTSNKDVAIRSSEIFNNLLRKDGCHFDISEVSKIACWQNDSLIKEKFMMKKRFLRFKESVLSHRFRAFLHMWKEDMHWLSTRKYRAKSQKKIDLSLRTPHFGFQKHRSSVRSRSCCPAGSSLVPTTEIINSASKLLMDTQLKHYRSTLKMPTLILDKKEKMLSRFISNNGLVEDPCSVEKERAMINPWTSAEKETFMDKLAIIGKDFRKIASFLDHKTTADCVEFYYKNHKSDGFAKTKKLEHKKPGMSLPTNAYLLNPGKKWNRDLNAAPLDMLRAASVLAAGSDGYSERTCSGRFLLGYSDSKTLCSDDSSINFNIHGSDKEAAAADALVGICGSLSSEALNSCITSAVDPRDSYQEWKYLKGGSVTKHADNETCSDESCGEMDSADWTDEEKSIFVQAVSSYGKDFARISQCVRTRSRDQCKVFFSKARKCLGLDLIHPFPGTGETLLSDDADRSGSDAEDACLLETASLICSNKSSSKMDVDLASSVLSLNHNESDPGGNMYLQADLKISEEKNLPGNADFEDSKSRVDSILNESLATRNEVTRQHPSVEELPSLVAAGEALPRSEVVEIGGLASVSEERHGTESQEEKLMLPKNTSTDERDRKEECYASTSGRAGFHCSLRKSKSVGDTSHLGMDTNDSSSSLGLLECRPNDFSGLDCTQQSQMISTEQDTTSVVVNARDCHSAAVQYGGNHKRYASSTTFGFEDIRVKRSKENCASSENNRKIPQGLSLHTPTKIEMNGDIGCKQQPPAFHILQKLEKNMPFGYSAHECYLQRCNGSKAHGSADEMQLPLRNLEQSSDHPTAHARSLSDPEEPSSKADLKIFGKILTHASSMQKEIDSNRIHQSRSNYLSLENLPIASNGFWGEPNLNSVPVFPTAEMSSSHGVVDYTKVPSLIIGMKQRQDVCCEVQRRNGIEAVSRTMVGMNGVGRGGGVSDPVAAMKVHYANTDRLVGRVGREEEPWRDAKDVGR